MNTTTNKPTAVGKVISGRTHEGAPRYKAHVSNTGHIVIEAPAAKTPEQKRDIMAAVRNILGTDKKAMFV